MYEWVDCSVSMKRWKRVNVRGLESWVKGYEDEELFVSVQQYAGKERTQGEPFLMPVFWDLDDERDLPRVLDEARRLVRGLRDHGLKDGDIRVNFSGHRGFHIVTNPFALGIEPAPNIHVRVKVAAEWLADSLKLESVDRGVYSVRRLLRVVGSRHKCGLRAVRLPLEALETWDVDKILAAARDASHGSLEPGARLFDPGGRPYLASSWWWGEAGVIAEAWRSSRREAAAPLVRRARDLEDLPACITDLLKDSIRNTGDRNRATLLLATFFRSSEVPRETAENVAVDWARKIPPELTSTRGSAIEGNTRSVFASVYRSPESYFSCGFARSLGLRCNKIDCTWIAHPEEGVLGEDDSVITLEEAVSSDMVDQDIVVEGIVGVAAKQPKIIPTKIKIICGEDGTTCKRCPCTKSAVNEVEITEPRLLLELSAMNSRDKKIELFLRIAGYPKRCDHRRVEIIDHANLLHAAVHPACGFTDAEQFRENQVYVTTHALELQKHYRMWGKTVPFPATNDACHVISRTKALRSPYDHFDMTGELFDRLSSIFNKGPKIIDEIHESFEKSVHGIIGRRVHSKAMDIILHTAIEFKLLGVKSTRGWGQGLAFGKSGHGKTVMLGSLMKWYDVGEIKSVEGMSYAGLAGGVDRIGPSFVVRLGHLCRHDRGWIGLDEWHKAGQELAMRMARIDDDGVVDIVKITEAKAYARVRKMRLANCIDKHGNSIEMDSKVYPVEHALNISWSYENLRRVDLVLGFGESPELLELINSSDHHIEPGSTPFDRESCRLLIQWAASRRVDDIVWETGAEKHLLDVSRRLAGKYHCDLPILIISDARWKIARLAVGCAARRFSTRDGQTLIVESADIDYVSSLIEELYDSDELALDKYAAAWRQRTASDNTALKESFNRVELYTGWYEAFQIMIDSPLRVGIRDMCEALESSVISARGEPLSPRNWVSAFVSILKQENLVERRGSYYSMTAKGIRLAKESIAQFDHAKKTGESGWLVNYELTTDGDPVDGPGDLTIF